MWLNYFRIYVWYININILIWSWGWCEKAKIVSIKELFSKVVWWKNENRVELFLRKKKSISCIYFLTCVVVIAYIAIIASNMRYKLNLGDKAIVWAIVLAQKYIKSQKTWFCFSWFNIILRYFMWAIRDNYIWLGRPTRKIF